MWVTLHAITLSLLPVLTIAAVAKSPARLRLTEIAVAALFGAAVFMILAPSFSTCCDEPLQWRQLLIPTASAMTAIVFVRRKELSLAIALASLMLAFLLAFHFAALLGSRGWTGKRNLAQQSVGMARRRLLDIQAELRGVQDDTSYPPCWLRDHPIRELAIAGAVRPPSDSWSEPAWHSWLTGLYRRHDIDRDFWYPGGRLSEAADKLELRERPSQVDAPQRPIVTGRQSGPS